MAKKAKKAKAPPKKTGRPTKLTPEVEAALMKAISTGCRPRDAAAYAGVPFHLVLTWSRQGRKPNAREPYKGFHTRFTEAKRKMKVLALGFIGGAMPKDWKAAAWFLERCFPEEFARRDRVTLEGRKGKPVGVALEGRVAVDPVKLDPAVIREAGELLAKMTKGSG